jgi:ADP-ribose diphosphatase
MRKLPDITAIHTLASSTLFKMEAVHLTFSNGAKRVFERIVPKTPTFGSVMIIAITHDDQIILGREYAVGTEQYELSLQKGIIELNETPEEAANRELQEEIGMGAHTCHLIGTLSTAPHYFSSHTDIVIARDLYPSRLTGDEPEPIEPVSCSMSDIDTRISTQEITEARTIAAIYLAKQWLLK